MTTISKETINNSINKHYTAFADDVRSTLFDKLSSHPEIEKYTQAIDHMNMMKQAFMEINK